MCSARPGARALAGVLVLIVLGGSRSAGAHGGGHAATGLTEAVVIDAATALLLGVAAIAYALGLVRLRARSSVGSIARAVAYLSGLAVIAIAQLSPLDTHSEIRFSVHMSQHELLVLFAAPLVVVGRPELVLRAAFGAAARGALGTLLHTRPLRALLRIATQRWVAVVLHGVVVWLWHLPVLFEAALHSEAIHALQHLSFFATAALFWWAMARGRYGPLGYGLAVVFVFITALHKGLLAMLFTVAERPLYPTHVERTQAAGGDPLVDQALAGVLMWVPAGVITAAIALAMFVAWMGAIERRATRADRPPTSRT